MGLAINILTSELESYRRCAREELKYSVYPEYRGPNEDFGKNIIELQQAIAHLQSSGTQPTIDNTGSLKLLERCRDYIDHVGGRSKKGDILLSDLNEQLKASRPEAGA